MSRRTPEHPKVPVPPQVRGGRVVDAGFKAPVKTPPAERDRREPSKPAPQLLPHRVGRYATVADVEARWGREASDAEAALIDLRIADVERMILHRIPDLDLQVVEGRIFREDVIQVEAEVVLRLMRNPQGFISETDGDYSYQLAKELSTGRLDILDEEWAALGFRRSRMSILVPEPIVEVWEDDDDLLDEQPKQPAILFDDEASLPFGPTFPLAVTKVDRQIWLYDPYSPKANMAGWVTAGSASLPDGVSPGQGLVWDDVSGSWKAGAARLDTLDDVDVSAALGSDVLCYDDATQTWVPMDVQSLIDAAAAQALMDAHLSEVVV